MACLAVLAVLLAAGCDDRTPAAQTATASPLAGCPPSPAAVEDGALAGVTLPCFTGGDPVRLAALGRPAVINLWASWCTPCRQELPALQRLADDAGDDLVVLGVVTKDSPAKAASLAEELAVTFPAVIDEDGVVLRTTGQPGLPVTLFVDAQGRVKHVYATGVLTAESVKALVGEHLGVTVP